MTQRWPCDAIEVLDGTPRLAFPPQLVTGVQSVLTRCAIRIWTIRGVWPDNRNFGLPLLDWSLASVPRAEIQAQVRRQLAAVDGVLRVIGVDVNRPGTELRIGARVEIAADEPVQAVVGDLGVYAGTVPGAWYQILGTGYRPIFPIEAIP